MVVDSKSKKILELGCGLGRILKHYHGLGYSISGIDRCEVAIKKLKKENPALDIKLGDIRALDLKDESFDVVLAFGVFHNIPEGIENALQETRRALRKGGKFCISMKPDNFESWLNDSFLRWRERRSRSSAQRRFYKMLVDRREFEDLCGKWGLNVEQVHFSRNLSFLYRIPFLREKSEKQATETARRSNGYQLNRLGRMIDRCLTWAFPESTADLFVFIGTRE